MLTDSLHSYAWDVETRPTTIDTVTATYDAFGRMVEQTKAGVSTEIQYAPSGFKMQTLNGQTVKNSFVPLPGGTVFVPQCACYFDGDWLGGSRFSSTYFNRTMKNDLAYAPYGEQYAAAGAAPLGLGNVSFAGNNEDTATNLYDAQFREYEPFGRWPSPDPAGIAAANPANPQSWNRYAYVMNNPLALVDPTGLACREPNRDPSLCGGINIVPGVSNANDFFLMLFFASMWESDWAPSIESWGQDDEGHSGWVDSPLAIAEFLQYGNNPSPDDCLPSKYENFFNTQYPAAAPVADQTNVDVTLLLGVSALESGWGTSPMSQNQNNPFGATPGGDSTHGLTYSSFTAAWNSWGNRWGSAVQGDGTNANAFITDLFFAGYNTMVPPQGDPQWATKVAANITSVQKRFPDWSGGAQACPGQ